MPAIPLSRRDWLRTGGAWVSLTALGAQEPGDVPDVAMLIEGSGFVPITPGEFDMGSETGNPDERPVHRVRIGRPFEMAKYEITQEQWDIVMRDPHTRAGPVNPSQFKGRGHPVESVSWAEVQTFLRRMNVRDNKHLYRLPTEAEWEYVCRAGSSGDPLGGPVSTWFGENAGGSTHQVGLKAPNAWGLYDMLGNVAEWVNDWFDHEYYLESPVDDPPGPADGSYKVYRGGCWFNKAADCRPSYRGFDFPSNQYYSVGFRLVREKAK